MKKQKTEGRGPRTDGRTADNKHEEMSIALLRLSVLVLVVSLILARGQKEEEEEKQRSSLLRQDREKVDHPGYWHLSSYQIGAGREETTWKGHEIDPQQPQ